MFCTSIGDDLNIVIRAFQIGPGRIYLVWVRVELVYLDGLVLLQDWAIFIIPNRNCQLEY